MKHFAHQLVRRRIRDLKPFAKNARTHSKAQIRQIANSLQSFGFTNPILVSDDGEIVAGHGRVAAAKLLGWEEVPTLVLSHLNLGGPVGYKRPPA
jgi:ParB-like chromosome segregation protein Spo0J